ncbi:MAG: flavodoxin family protein [Nitrospirota bacterium]
MKKTIALMSSPRIESNTDILTDKIIEGVKSNGTNVEVEKVNLVDYQSYVCRGCGQCRPTGNCEQYSEVNSVLQKIKEGDGMIIGTPTWWMGPSSQLKIFMDHFGAYLAPDYSSRIAGKRCVIVACNGNAEVNFAEQVCKNVADILGFLQVNVKSSLGLKGLIDKGAAAKHTDMLDKAFNMGRELYS